jgi:hypothetical protein
LSFVVFIYLFYVEFVTTFENDSSYPSFFYLWFFVEFTLINLLNWYIFLFYLLTLNWLRINFSFQFQSSRWSFLIFGFMIFFNFLFIHLSRCHHLNRRYDGLAWVDSSFFLRLFFNLICYIQSLNIKHWVVLILNAIIFFHLLL